MPTRAFYAQGVPCWVDLQTSDQAAARSFYGQLFGWSYDEQELDETMTYSIATLGSEGVAAIGPQPERLRAMGVPPMWNSYLAVEDLDEVAARVALAGGQLAMTPTDVMEAGRMAFALDPTGAAIGLWEAKNTIGATLVNEPGTLIWNELQTADVHAAAAFYEQVFGLTSEQLDLGEMPYTVFSAEGAQVAGATDAAPGVPNHWAVYFCVDDVASQSRRVQELGGSLQSPATETPIGTIALVSDPQGASFFLFQPLGAPS